MDLFFFRIAAVTLFLRYRKKFIPRKNKLLEEDKALYIT